MFYVFADDESIFNPLDDGLSIIGPKVTLELGKSGSFQFSIPSTNSYYNSLEELKTFVRVELDSIEIFRGRVLSIKRGFNNIKTVYCEGILSYLVDSVQKGKRFNGKAKNLYKKILERHNRMVEKNKRFNLDLCTFNVENATVVIPGKKDDDDEYFGENKYEQAIIESLVNEWQTTYDYINALFIDYLGGYLIARYNPDLDCNYINYISNEELDSRIELAQENNSADHEIEFGVNMVDFEEEVSAEDMFTVLIPLGDGEEDVLTIANATNKYSDSSIEIVDIQGKPIGIADRNARSEYGSIVKTYSFENVNNPNTLFSNAVKYLKRHKNMPKTYTIKAVDLHFVNKTTSQIEIGDSVKITSQVHGVDRYLLCTRIEYDLANPANTQYTFGNPEQSLTERYKKNKDKDKKETAHNDKRAAKGGGSAAGAARDDAINEAQDKVDKLYDAYLKVDDAAGTITMATLYHDMVDGVKKLKAMSGIDLSAGPDEAKVNIYTMYDDIGKANTRITQVSDSAHAGIEMVSQYAIGVNEALTSFTQFANDTYASQEMLTKYNTDLSESISGVKTYADSTFATAELFAQYKNTTDASLSAFASFQAKTTKDFANYLTIADYDTKASAAKSSIEGWANSKFAKIDIMTTYKGPNGNTLAQIEAIATDNKSQINSHASTLTKQAATIANLNILTDNLKSVIEATTNYNDLKINKTTGKLEGVDDNARLKLTSDRLKAAIDSTADFDKYIDGKLVHSTASIKQEADKNQSKISLVANFGTGTGGSIVITSLKDDFKKKIESSIVLTADNIEANAQKTIALTAKETIVDSIFKGKDVAVFSRNVLCSSDLTVGKALMVNGNTSMAGGFTCTGDGKVTGGNLYVGKNKVALESELTSVNIRKLLRGTYDTVTEYIKELLGIKDGSKYITLKQYIENTIESKVNSSYVVARFTKADIQYKICGNESLSDWVKDKAYDKLKGHTHSATVSVSKHAHTLSEGETKTGMTTPGASITIKGMS